MGVLTNTGALNLKAGSKTLVGMSTNTTAGAGWDLAVVEGSGSIGGSLAVVITNGFAPTNIATFLVMTNTTTSFSGGFDSLVAMAYTTTVSAVTGVKPVGQFTVLAGGPDHPSDVTLSGYKNKVYYPGSVYTMR